MRIYKQDKDYTFAGTKKRNTRIANTLLDALENPVILASPDNTWNHPTIENQIMLSNGNSKVNLLGQTLSTKAVAYGKTTILSCPFAANCVKFCYQGLNNYTASARMHGHNYLMVYGQSRDTISQRIQSAIDNLPKGTTIVRLSDNGDMISLAEILAWVDIAVNNPSIVFYGYTKTIPSKCSSNNG